MRYKIYPLIKKNKFNCVLVVKYRYRIQEHEKLTNKVSLSNEKNLQTFLVCPC